MSKPVFPILLILLLLCQKIQAQQEGKIVFCDSSFITISQFTMVRTEMYLVTRNGRSGMPMSESLDFIHEYSPDKIKNLRFIYEKGKATDQFYYMLIVEGIKPDGSLLKKKIKAWDWLETSVPDLNSEHATDIVFFTENKKLDIARIEFGN